jgi:hypothetical protein
LNNGFNSNFYIVTATVIPVFYLALVVQAPMLNRIVSRLGKSSDRMWVYPTDKIGHARRYPKVKLRSFILIGSSLVPFIVGAAALISSIVGEIDSVLALYYQSDNKYYRRATLTAIFVLLGATLLLPLWTMLVAYVRFHVYTLPKEERERLQDRWRKRWWTIIEPELLSPEEEEHGDQETPGS